MTRYVGLDLSTKTGLVILDDKANVIYEEEIEFKDAVDPERMKMLWEYVKSKLNFKTDVIAIEGFSFGSKGQGVDFQYGIGWIVRLMLFNQNKQYFDVPPTVVKKFVSGKGNAKKEALILPLYKKWGYEHDSDNVRDAYILARIAYSTDHIDELKVMEKGIISDLLNPKKTARKKK